MHVNNNDLLGFQVKTFQDNIPKTVTYRKKEKFLTEKETWASRRAVWFIIKKGYGINSAVTRVSGSFGCSPSIVERAVRPLFPKDYFKKLENYKNHILYEKIQKE
tara:strand:- start:1132 stop:1446 length:315 start_codon:yes stop_codon:yes gene_type:complete